MVKRNSQGIKIDDYLFIDSSRIVSITKGGNIEQESYWLDIHLTKGDYTLTFENKEHRDEIFDLIINLSYEEKGINQISTYFK